MNQKRSVSYQGEEGCREEEERLLFVGKQGLYKPQIRSDLSLTGLCNQISQENDIIWNLTRLQPKKDDLSQYQIIVLIRAVYEYK